MKKAKLPTNRFRPKTFALTAMAAAVACAVSPTAMAQDNDADNASVEEITVTGIRSSLERATDIKRNASGVVDAISAEDIGKFPDANLAESVQRITGVSIDRVNNEGSKVTVRGFGPRFNLVTLNGRTLPTSSAFTFNDTDRSFNFNELASSSVSAVEVFKTGRADLPTGGIGSTVNIRSAKPFDYNGFKASGVLKANHDTTVENGSTLTPDLSLLVSNRFMDDRLGLLASVSYSERDSASERGTTFGAFVGNAADGGVDLSANQNPGGITFAPTNFNLEIADTERERTNAQFVLQYALTDNLDATLDYTLSRFDENTERHQTGFWFEFNGTRTGSAAADGVQNLTDINADIDFFGFDENLVTDNDSFGLNLDWHVNDNLSFEFDAHTSSSESQPDGEIAQVITNFQSTQNVTVSADYTNGGDIPLVNISSPTNPFQRDGLRLDLIQNQTRQVKNDVDEFKLAGKYEFDNSALQNLTFGVQRTEFDYAVSQRAFNFLIGSPEIATIPAFDALQFDFIPRGSVGDDFSGGGPGLFPTLGVYDVGQAGDIINGLGLVPNFDNSVSGVNEETTSLFLQADFEGTLGSMPLSTNLGVRYESTDVEGRTRTQLVTGLQFTNTAELLALRENAFNFETAEGDYSYVLPNIDFALQFTDNLVGRLSYSETLSRSPVSVLTPSTNITALRPNTLGNPETGVFLATQGNPGLEPAISDNIDLSFEWYYKEGSYAAIGFFDKTVNAFVSSATVEDTILGANGDVIRNPSLNPRPGCPSATDPACFSDPSDPAAIFDISRLSNSSDEGNVQGFELALQHVFDNGFGFITNYTFTDGDIEFDTSNFDQQSPEPLVGLSDSANLVAFYEKDRFSTRLAYNWRDDFFNGLGFGNEPIFVESFAQLDISASYILNDRYTIFVEGLNITDETTRRHFRSQDLLSDVFSYGPRFSFGIRGNF